MKIIFNDYQPFFDKKLIKLIHDKNKNNLDIIIAILKKYSGTDGVYTMCKEIVKFLPHRSKKLNSVKSILSGHGDFITKTGEFGMSEYYKKQKEMMLTWCQDKNMKVKKFAKKLLEDMANDIADARRREENSMELRKREY